MPTVYVSIGSNIAREASIRGALRLLELNFGPVVCSPIYESAPVGFDGPPFWNLVAAFEASGAVSELVATLKSVEAACGRVRDGVHVLSRTMDVDLLLYGDMVCEEPVALPRDEIERYAFVLRPLAELAPTLRHPVTGEAMQALWARFDSSREHLEPVLLPEAAASGG